MSLRPMGVTRPGLDNSIRERLDLDHERLSESLRALEACLDRLDDAAVQVAFLTQLEALHAFCEQEHFPLEDAVLEDALERGLTPLERRVVFMNLAQHQQIYAEAVGVLTRGPSSEASGSAGGPEFQARALTYVNAMRAHLEFETRHLGPLLARHLWSSE